VVPSKTCAVILGEPICWRCWATDLSRKERGKVVPSKIVRRSSLANLFSLVASRRTGSAGRHEEKWFLRKKYAPQVEPDSWTSV
jgi:hypothetical protein